MANGSWRVASAIVVAVLAGCSGGGSGGGGGGGPQTLSVTVTGSGAGAVTSSPAGISCAPGGVGTCSASFPQNTLVTLTASPSAGSTFGGWGGACSGTGACSVTLGGNMSLSAVIGLTRTLSITVSGTGSGSVTSSPAGISCAVGNVGNCSATFADGAPVALNPSTGTSSYFDGWSGACAGGGTCPLTLSGDLSATASFTRTHTLTVTVSGTGSGTVHASTGALDGPLDCSAGTCTVAFLEGTTLSLTAATNPGSALTAWGGDCTGASSCDLTMSADRSVSATFGPTYMLTVHFAGAGTGTVTSSPAGISCTTGMIGTCSAAFLGGAPVTLTATPDAASYTAGWTGATCAGSTCNVTLSADQTVTTTFSARPVVTVVLAGDGAGTVTSEPPGISCTTGSAAGCTAAFDPGIVVTLAPAPSGSASFVAWGMPCWNERGTCVFGTSGNVTATATFTGWEERRPFPRSLLAAATLGGTMLAVGAGDSFVTSTDGLAWTGHPERKLAGTVRGIAVDGVAGRAVVVGDAGLALWSDDGITWSAATGTPSAQLNAVARGGSAFVAVGNGGAIVSSSDGTTWSSRTSGTAYNLLGVAYGAGTFVATGVGGTVLTSSDGQTWTDRSASSGTTQTLNAVTSGASGFVAVGTNGAIAKSPDGLTGWSAAQFGTSPLTGVAAIGGTYVAVDGVQTAVYSTDLSTWHTSALAPSGGDYTAVAALGGRFFALGRTGSMVRAPTPGVATGWSLALPHAGLQLYDAAYAVSTYVVTGYDGAIFSSPDGIVWTSRRANFDERIDAIAYGNGTFVAVGSAAILTSPDGLAWSQAAPFSNGADIAYAPGNGFVIVTWSTPAAIVTSPDGITWTTQGGTGITGTTQLQRIAHGASKFVAVGPGGVYTHPSPGSGGEWTPQASPSGSLDDVAFGNGTFVVVTWTTPFQTSTSLDAITWSALSGSGGSTAQQFLGFANGLFATTGFYTSADGATWTAPQTLPLYETSSGVKNASDGVRDIGVDAAAYGHAGWAGAKSYYWTFPTDSQTTFVRHP